MATTIRLEIDPLKRQTAFFLTSSHGKRMFKQWGVVYRGFLQRRFARQSRSGWKRLNPKTIARRRKKSDSVLRDVGLLFAALSPTVPGPGGFEQVLGKSSTVGYGGGAMHTSAGMQGSLKTIAEIAEIHDLGLGNNPQREIVVDPDIPTLDLMANITTNNLDRAFA